MNASLGLVKELRRQGENEGSGVASTAASSSLVGGIEERLPDLRSDSRIVDSSGSVSNPHGSTTESRLETDFGSLVVDDGKSESTMLICRRLTLVGKGGPLPSTFRNRRKGFDY